MQCLLPPPKTGQHEGQPLAVMSFATNRLQVVNLLQPLLEVQGTEAAALHDTELQYTGRHLQRVNDASLHHVLILSSGSIVAQGGAGAI